MLPFSKRPPPPEEYFLRSGDFQAMNAYGATSPAIPPAPRAPVFARQAAHTPYGFSNRQQHGHYGDLSVPPPPNSLAPVAMGSYGGAATGSHAQRALPTVTIREKPSLKWGVMIALTGALLGGVLGLGMDAKRQQARAAAAAEARDAAPLAPLAVTTALPAAAALNGLNAVPASLPAPVSNAPVARPAAVLPPSAPLAVTPVTPAKVDPVAKPEKRAKTASVKHQGFVAAKIPRPPAEKADAPEPPAKTEKVEAPAKAEKPTKGGASDARKVLEDAIKDTTNTL